MQYSTAIDRKWQKYWEEIELSKFDLTNLENKLYVLEMFSYPSGANLHVGHWYNYSLADSWARFMKMNGKNIFQPMGFDAFGLPAENYAIKTGVHPKDSTYANIATMREQLRQMGGLFDWSHELATCSPEYYRWNQWLFQQLYKNNLAYQKEAPVNWCPSCQTVLANEQVDSKGCCDRCGTIIERKNLKQWFFGITKYAEELLNDLETLDWPEKTKKIQANWIGRSEGVEVIFSVCKGGAFLLDSQGQAVTLPVFTTRADTLLGVTYVVVAPESKLCADLTTPEQYEAVSAYLKNTQQLSEIDRQSTTREKTGIFTGSYAVHPITHEEVPIWAADYVIASYGTGVVMAVPAHDERDFAFAKKYNLPIKATIIPCDHAEVVLPYCEKGELTNSGKYDGMTSSEAIAAIVADLGADNLASLKINYRLRDWLVSRQRYWGTPIPVIHCPDCGTVLVPDADLPVELPYDVEFTPDGDSPLKRCKSFMDTTCPQCGKPAQRDPDTLDTFVCSSWYQFRYVDNQNKQEPFRKDLVDAVCPVDQYVGGAEHATMHLLYARFITKALRDMGYLSFNEPFLSLLHQGTILGEDGQKMSKSRGNTVSPDEYVEKYGSDVFRLYLAFAFAFTEGGPWSDSGVEAMARFVTRVNQLTTQVLSLKNRGERIENADLEYARNYAIKHIDADAARFQLNTSIARLMEWLNAFQKYLSGEANAAYAVEVLGDFVAALAPFAPHLGEELWSQLGHKSSVFLHPFPICDPAKLIRNETEIAVQINGKIVARIMIPTQSTQAEITALTKANPDFSTWLDGRAIVKEICVPTRLINFVVK